jgi:biopolymer transport protein ExbD
MRFFVRKRRSTPTVIIVALIDVLIVLLIFLIVTTTFKQQPALKLALPESSQALKSGAHEDAPEIVTVDAQGNLLFGADARPVTVDGLKQQLLALVEKNPQLKLAISADKSAPVGQLVKVMDATREAGIKSPLMLYTKEPGKP